MAYPGYGAPPPGGYGGYPPPPAGGAAAYGTYSGYGAPPPAGAGAYASAAQYGTTPAGYGGYTPPASYGAPPPAGGAAPYASVPGYPPQYGGGYGAPPPGAGYGAPPPSGYGAPPPGAGYGAAPPGAGYGAPPPSGYGAPPPGAGYGAPPPGAGYGAPPPGNPASYGAGPPAGNTPGMLAPADSKWPRPPRTSTGNRKALLIGINYIGHTQGRLNGCINDVKNVYQFLTIGAGFNPAQVRVLTDDQTDPSKIPNRANIEAGMKWLAEGASPGDSLFFHYSGHGGQERDPTFLEDDGMNETICPCDYQTAGQIIDDKIHAYLAKPLPAGCRLTAVFDSCHSGTVMDLPYTFKSQDSRYKHAHRADDDTFMKRHKKTGFHGGVTSILLNHVGGEVAFNVKRTARQKINEKINSTKADVIQISGCRDEQTSADATLGGQATGVMSWSLMEALRHDPNVTYEQLITNMRDLLQDGPTQFRQVPQVSYGNPRTDMTELFTL